MPVFPLHTVGAQRSADALLSLSVSYWIPMLTISKATVWRSWVHPADEAWLCLCLQGAHTHRPHQTPRLPSPTTGRNQRLLFSHHLIWGILSQQPKQTKTCTHLSVSYIPLISLLLLQSWSGPSSLFEMLPMSYKLCEETMTYEIAVTQSLSWFAFLILFI